MQFAQVQLVHIIVSMTELIFWQHRSQQNILVHVHTVYSIITCSKVLYLTCRTSFLIAFVRMMSLLGIFFIATIWPSL